jgi:cellulose synthase (UDP-forming)
MLNLLLPVFVVASVLALTRWAPRHPRWRSAMVFLNVAATSRYLWWRYTETLNWDGGWSTAVSIAMFGAECYGFLVVLHHYVVAMRSVPRAPAPPPGRDFCPNVDIYVTSYNEDVDIIRRTLVGCQAIEYRNKRVYLLDDGRRTHVAELCTALGVDYITRDNNQGAKAGNINNAFRQTAGEFVVTFDADHVPVSSFLSETLGYFRDEAVAQVQTAHHFFNPDLFQDRLKSADYVANEQDMFNHIVQPGRDIDNASFYCGSGAIFRRSALENIGGLPTSTETEDLHTSMLLHSKGWQSVYVNKDLSAGLAPESFEGYLTQRRRWSRGTLQVMWRQGGLTLPGLTVTQRIHYFATMWYWLHGIPRVIYLVSPLFFLLLGIRPLLIHHMSDLLVFYLPHLYASVAAFQVVNRGLRRIFWSDVYESSIAVQIAITTLMFPFSGRRVRFAVTPKGQDATRNASRKRLALGWPLVVLTAVLIVGVVRGTFALATSTGDLNSLSINVFWAAYNLVVVVFGLLLLRVVPQSRYAPRIARQHQCRLQWSEGEAEGTLRDLSETGVSLVLETPAPLPDTLEATITSKEGRAVTVRARLIRSEYRNGRVVVALHFLDRTDEQHRRLIELMFSAPDSWNVDHERTLSSAQHLRRIIGSLREVYSRRSALRRLAPRFPCDFTVVIRSQGQPELAGHIVDMSHLGMRVRVAAHRRWRENDQVHVLVRWNDSERSTLAARVKNVIAEGTETHLGLVFQALNQQQEADIFKHVYPQTAGDAARKAAA